MRADLVRQRHQQACRGCVPGCSLRSRLRPGRRTGRRGCRRKASNIGAMRDLVVTHAQPRRHLAGIDPGDVGGVRRRHHHGTHLVGAERVDGQRQHQGRIDAARQADDGAGESVLAEVVAHARDQRRPGLRFQRGRVVHVAAQRRRHRSRRVPAPHRNSVRACARHPVHRARTTHRRTPPRPGRRPGASTAAADPSRARARPCAASRSPALSR